MFYSKKRIIQEENILKNYFKTSVMYSMLGTIFRLVNIFIYNKISESRLFKGTRNNSTTRKYLREMVCLTKRHYPINVIPFLKENR